MSREDVAAMILANEKTLAESRARMANFEMEIQAFYQRQKLFSMHIEEIINKPVYEFIAELKAMR